MIKQPSWMTTNLLSPAVSIIVTLAQHRDNDTFQNLHETTVILCAVFRLENNQFEQTSQRFYFQLFWVWFFSLNATVYTNFGCMGCTSRAPFKPCVPSSNLTPLYPSLVSCSRHHISTAYVVLHLHNLCSSMNLCTPHTSATVHLIQSYAYTPCKYTSCAACTFPYMFSRTLALMNLSTVQQIFCIINF